MRSTLATLLVVLLLAATAQAESEDDSDPCRNLLNEDRRVLCNRDRKEREKALNSIADLDQAIARSPDQMDLRRDRGMLLHSIGEHGRAIEDFDKVLAAKPDGHVMFFRGLSYIGKGDDTRGFADLAKGIELAPDDHSYRYQRGSEYAKRGQTDAALADVDKAIALKSDDRFYYLLRADLYTKKGDTEKAIADLTRAAELDPAYYAPYFNRVLLYEQTGQYDRAIADYDKLLSLSPGNAYYTERRAAVLSKAAASATEAPAAKAPPEKGAEPLPADAQVSKPGAAGKGDCRRYDALSNMTIAVPCPD